MDVPDSDDLRAIRKRDADSADTWFKAPNNATARAMQDRRALLKLLDDFIEQANEGCFVEHDCPAMFACTYIIANTCAPEEPRTGKEGGQ
jgi:hypothetical protein